ncbi:carbohydrate-binding protein [Polaromonas sp.]|nr:carbohydrate-binding protein [Candidatus Saccharibacteria bacterium]
MKASLGLNAIIPIVKNNIKLIPLVLVIIITSLIGIKTQLFSNANSCSGIGVPAGSDVQAAVNANPDGTTFCLGGGTHRLQSVSPKNGQKFVGQGQGVTVLSGASLLSSFIREGNYYVATGQTQQGQQIGECQTQFPRCAYPEDLFMNDKPLQHVPTLAEVAPGKWFFNYDTDKIYFIDDPAGKTVETSVNRLAFSGNVSNVSISDLTIEKYASPAQVGAVHIGQFNNTAAVGWIIDSVTLRLNHGVGLMMAGGSNHILRNSRSLNNGQLGLGGAATNMLVEYNEIAYNNANNWFNPGWEAGGTKWAFSDGLTVRNNHSHHNHGPGLWTDIDNIRTVYEYNLVEDNDQMGIFHEISYDAKIRNNVVRRNGLVSPIGWLYSSGILISSSSNTEVNNNHVEGNYNGITTLQQNRGTGKYGPRDVRNISMHDNIVIGSGTSGAAQDIGDASFFTARNITFQANKYFGNHTWSWNNGTVSWSNWQSYGQDTAGSFSATGTPPAAPVLTVGPQATATPIPAADITPPTTSLTNPANGATISGSVSVTATATDNVSVTSLEYLLDGVIKGTGATHTLNTTTIANGAHTIQFKAYDAAGNIGASPVVSVTVNNQTAASVNQTPFAGAVAIPGQIEAENYDQGGETIAYHDADVTNNGNSYRNDGVDVSSAFEGGYKVGWTKPGEWLEYSVNVTTAGSYQFQARVSNSAVGGALHAEVDGSNVTGALVVPNTGGYDAFTTITKDSINLNAGQHIVRIYFDTASATGFLGDFNWFGFMLPTAPPAPVAATADTAAPTIPGNLRATLASGGRTVSLTWNASSDNKGVSGYYIYRNNVKIVAVTGGVTSYRDAAVDKNVPYTYTVAAYDAAYNVSGQSTSVSARPTK